MVNTYLVVAFSLVWVIFIVYAWSLARRQSGLQRQLDDLKQAQQRLSARANR